MQSRDREMVKSLDWSGISSKNRRPRILTLQGEGRPQLSLKLIAWVSVPPGHYFCVLLGGGDICSLNIHTHNTTVIVESQEY